MLAYNIKLAYNGITTNKEAVMQDYKELSKEFIKKALKAKPEDAVKIMENFMEVVQSRHEQEMFTRDFKILQQKSEIQKRDEQLSELRLGSMVG